MALTNAERQKRWREKRNKEADTITGRTPKEIAEKLLSHFGVKDLKRVMRAADKRLRNIKPDCPRCQGTGFGNIVQLPDGRTFEIAFPYPCDCRPMENVVERYVAILHGGGKARACEPRKTTAEAQKDAQEWREDIASLKRKPRGTIHVVTVENYSDMLMSCGVEPVDVT